MAGSDRAYGGRLLHHQQALPDLRRRGRLSWGLSRGSISPNARGCSSARKISCTVSLRPKSHSRASTISSSSRIIRHHFPDRLRQLFGFAFDDAAPHGGAGVLRIQEHELAQALAVPRNPIFEAVFVHTGHMAFFSSVAYRRPSYSACSARVAPPRNPRSKYLLARCQNSVIKNLRSLPRKGCRVGLRIVLFEACSAFTRVAACTLALSPIRDTHSEGFSQFVTSLAAPAASGWSGRRVGLAPTGKRRLVTAHTRSGHLSAVELQAQSRNPLAGDCSLTGVRNNRERWLLWGPEFVWSFPCLMRGR
jgi:hypothetical protein